MLSTNVLCMKKRKKRSYYVSNVSDYGGTKFRNNKRNSGSTVGMMQITEDTPPDMLAGAMDLMVHLPDGKITKMAVERSTPMMDVLVQITNSNRLQISGYVLQPLAIKSSPSASERVLPYFPNTPIGALDTQDIRVVPKRSGGSSTLQRGGVPQQPFESTFRLKVHLPRNQLYVERVSMNAYLGDIMRKMCDEKNLDSSKYEFRHPGNLDETLDLQLRLADYQITEVHAVNKGTRPISQVFSSSDSIMAFRKEDERKQKSHGGGGIFNFLKRGKVSNGSGSLSSDNRSISPTHSDDSRSVSPPVSNGKMPLEKPKPPARKRRPAPKPPSIVSEDKKTVEDGTTTNVTMRKKDGITICHSRNSSDSSGYHEASILSDNANTSLPRKRPQTIVDGAGSKTSGNLTMMKAQSKSTSSLAFPNRNKKKAPAPPPGLKSAGSVARLETASPVVASPIEDDAQQSATALNTNTVEETETKPKNPEENSNLFSDRHLIDQLPSSHPCKDDSNWKTEEEECKEIEVDSGPVGFIHHEEEIDESQRKRSIDILEEEDYKEMFDNILQKSLGNKTEELEFCSESEDDSENSKNVVETKPSKDNYDDNFWDNVNSKFKEMHEVLTEEQSISSIQEEIEESDDQKLNNSYSSEELSYTSRDNTDNRKQLLRLDSEREYHSLSTLNTPNKPKIVGVVMKKKTNLQGDNNGVGDVLRRYKSMGDVSNIKDDEKRCTMATVPTNMDLFTLYLCSNYSLTRPDGGNNIKRNEESTFAPQHSPPESIASSLATTLSSNIETDIGTNIREIEEEEYEDNKIIENTNNCYNEVPMKSNENTIKPEVSKTEEEKEKIIESPKIETLIKEENVKKIPEEHQEPKVIETKISPAVIPDPLILPVTKPTEEKNIIPISPLETTDWEYRLPSPPTAFRDDTSPPNEVIKQESESVSDILPPSTDSILTSPELFEKLNAVKEAQTEVRSIQSIESEAVTVNDSEEKFISKLSLENLERRKQLVYNRELATSLKCPEQTEEAKETQKRNSVLGELEEVLAKPQNDAPNTESGKNWNRVKSAVENFSSRRDRTLPNFKITTYDIPKKNINIYEDDSVRSKVPNNSEDYNIQRVVRPSRQEFYKHRCMTLNRDLQRSESFNTWTPNAPVQRSKSQVAIKPDIQKSKEKDNTLIGEESRSRSTLDLTGLQSLEVMKAIRTTLTTTETTSTVTKSSKSIDEVDTSKKPTQEVKQITKEPSRRPVSMYTMPMVNLTSWKERKPSDNPTIPPKPTNGTTFTNLNGTHTENNETKKIPITNSKIPNETLKVSNENPKTNANQNNVNVSIKVNGTEAISQQAGGNVVIRIKPEQQKDESTQRFINHTTAIGYRKPLGNVNKVMTRPHSFAFDPFRYDASRVPIVRSVELKKPFKEAGSNNTSVTQIRHESIYLNGNNDNKVNNNVNKVNLFENVVLRSVASKREQRPQTVNLTDQRGQLLESIRNFGGKKGLKTVND